MAKLKAPFALDRSLNTTEQTSRNIADVLAEELSAIITALGGLNFINYEVVEELPTTGISTTTIYLVPSDDPQSGNTYDEYINLNGTVSGWEKIGSTDIDLSGYYTSAETDALLDEKVDKDSFDEQTAIDTFETFNGGLLSSLKVSLTPNQDLHGHDSPWVGGAGKNKLPLDIATIKSLNTDGTWSGNIYTIGSFTFTINTDDDGNITEIVGNGIGAESKLKLIQGSVLNELTSEYGDLILSGCPQGGGQYTYGIRIRHSTNVYQGEYGNGLSILSTRTYDDYVILEVHNNQVANNLKFYPMIRLSTESDPTFERYSNICPISGHTQVDVDVSDGDTTQEQVTVNLGGTYYSGILDVVTGAFVPDTASVDLGTLTWGVQSTSVTGKNRFRSGDISSVVKKPSANNVVAEIISSNYKAITAENTYSLNDEGISLDTAGAILIYDSTKETLTAEQFKTAVNGFKLVYALATPFTIQLSPTMVKALVGENHLSAPLEGQEITESKYKQMFTFDDVIAYIQSLS